MEEIENIRVKSEIADRHPYILLLSSEVTEVVE